MPIVITPADKEDITRIICPECKDKIKYIGLAKDSKIDGLRIKCKRCGHYMKVKCD
jgi:hypothetical protein